MEKRIAEVKRKTKETNITVTLNVDGSGKVKIDTSIGILDHMLELFAFHGLFDLNILAKGDLKVDIHHTNEDVGIVLGEAFKKALGDKKGIRRFGSVSVPMEDVTANVAVDISGRGSFKLTQPTPLVTPLIKKEDHEKYDFGFAEHFFEAFAKHLGMNFNLIITNSPLTVVVDWHTVLEPVFKGLGIALDQATQIDPRRKGIPSTKGVID
ncbi:MAG: imidazoleglycerol-phosphate dehydratase [Candidatus Omnitrophota bacterium]|nr:imidazoleglycerol-phosphate dehydratase [Candidatus Omnitrophota bacterium]